MKYQAPVPKWKSILRSVLCHLVLLILMLLIVGTIGFILLHWCSSPVYVLLGEGCDQFFSTYQK